MSKPNPLTDDRPTPLFALASPKNALGEDYRRRFIAVAPNGGRRTPTDHPALPISPEALANTAKSCLNQGASMMHVHVRNASGGHALDADGYRAALGAIRKSCGDNLVLQITTEALGIYPSDVQRNIVRDVKPEAASLAFRELAKDEQEAEQFALLLRWMREAGAAPQIIIYDTDDLDRFQSFLTDYSFPPEDFSVLYVLGRYVEKPQGLHQLLQFLNADAPRFRDLMVCAFGAEETACITAAALFGASARVGFENNLWLPSGDVAYDNADLVASSRASLNGVGLNAGTANDLRSLWGI
ncbi:MAG: 3-keto-5-aminohexanoate cleavage protein [Pseudomonadota bacterium]